MPNEKRAYLIAHGKRNFGPDPCHTQEGISQLQQIVLPEINLIVCGTGKRFREILFFLFPDWILLGYPVVVNSLFCGSADGLEADGRIILADGSLVNEEQCMGLVRATQSGIFDPWAFIDHYPHGTLFCSGGELLLALGLGNIRKYGGLYELSPQQKTGWEVS